MSLFWFDNLRLYELILITMVFSMSYQNPQTFRLSKVLVDVTADTGSNITT
jgi:hypothetical protein